MSGFKIDTDAVQWHARNLVAYTDAVMRSSWEYVDECGSEMVADAMAELREWFLSSWAEVDWALRTSSESGFTAAHHLAVADEQATSTARQGAAAMQGRG